MEKRQNLEKNLNTRKRALALIGAGAVLVAGAYGCSQECSQENAGDSSASRQTSAPSSAESQLAVEVANLSPEGQKHIKNIENDVIASGLESAINIFNASGVNLTVNLDTEYPTVTYESYSNNSGICGVEGGGHAAAIIEVKQVNSTSMIQIATCDNNIATETNFTTSIGDVEGVAGDYSEIFDLVSKRLEGSSMDSVTFGSVRATSVHDAEPIAAIISKPGELSVEREGMRDTRVDSDVEIHETLIPAAQTLITVNDNMSR